MNSFKIILFSVFASVIYGILHDLITAHLCVEYFSLGHPKVIESMSPVKLALVWGVIATWWVGLFLGIILAIAARAGRKSKLKLSEIKKTTLIFLVILFFLSIMMGCLGFFFAKNNWVYLVGTISEILSVNKHPYYIFDIWMHLTSYIGGFLGGIILAVKIWRRRS